MYISINLIAYLLFVLALFGVYLLLRLQPWIAWSKGTRRGGEKEEGYE